MKTLWWMIVIMTILAVPTTLMRGIQLLNRGSETQLWTWAVEVGFCIFFIALGLKIISGKIRDREEDPPPSPSHRKDSSRS
jgi:hypothetical protein